MKLIRYFANGSIRTGVLTGHDQFVDVTSAGSLLTLLMDGAARARAQQAALDASSAQALAGVELLAPVSPGKIIAIGLNYRDHAAEGGQPIPNKPIIFAKFGNSLANPNATITWYADQTTKMDYEAELGIVIGTTTHRVSEENALGHVGGYVCANDISARDLQMGDDQKQWVLGKSLDGSCPIGPSITTTDEIPDPQTLGIRCILNGQTVQNSNTAQMIFSVARLVAHCSHYMTLQPGDLIVTGTPPGVGSARKPPLFMKDGDEVTIEIDQIGRLTNRLRVL